MIEQQEILVAELLARGLVGRSSSWIPLTGGQTNHVWRVTCEDVDLVCKLYLDSDANPMFANEPQAEYDCLVALQDHGVAPVPKSFVQTALGPVLVYEHVSGVPWREGVEEVAGLVQHIHQVTPVQGLRKLSSDPAEIHAQTMQILEGLKGDLAAGVRSAAPRIAAVTIVPSVFLHSDVVPGNLIAAPDGLKLIDWQCPAIGDPVVDMAMFLSPAMHLIYAGRELTAAERDRFLAEFSEAAQDRYRKLAPLYHWRIAAYCTWKAEQGHADYDAAARSELLFLQTELM